MNVFVTGSSSCLSRALLPRLAADPDVERITGLDLAPPAFDHPKFSARQLDIRDPGLEAALVGHDALVHLAFVVLRGRMNPAEMFDINVNGSRKVFYAARRAGIARLIHMSSAAVYGSGVHVAEIAPLDPLPHFLYGQHKAQLEHMLEIEFPECVRLRPHVILGPHAQPLLKSLLRQPCYLQLPQPEPLLQCVHEDDVAQAVLLALKSDARGAFNLAVEENFSFREAVKRRHRVAIPLPAFIARAGLNAAWKLSGWGGEPAWLEGITRTLILNCRRAIVDLGWHSSYSAWEVIGQT